MSRKIRPLTNTEIKKAKPRDKVWYLFDGDGLQLAIKPIGSKLWQFKYSSPTLNKRRNMSFGSYEDVTLAQAREKRRECRSLIANGVDPIEYFKEKAINDAVKCKNTVGSIVEKWLKTKQTIRPRTLYRYKSEIRNHITPNFKDVRVDQLTPQLVLLKLNYLLEENKIYTLRTIVNLLIHVMRYSVSIGLVKYNLLDGITFALPTYNKTNFNAITIDELPSFLKEIDGMGCHKNTKLLFKFQLLTMVRSTEARLATWDEIDLERKVWVIPADRMKCKREHKVQLSEQVISIISQAKELCGAGGYIFKSTKHKKALSVPVISELINRSSFKGVMTAHGLRSVASTILNEHEFNPDIIESMLAHSVGGVRAIYNRSRHEERKRELYQWWADYCVSIGLEI